MANFKSLQMTPPVYPVSGPGIGGRSEKVERAFVDFSTMTTAGVGDTIDLFRLHPRFRVMGGFVKSTGAAASATVSVGDAGLANRYFNAVSITTAATTTAVAETGRDYLTPAYTLVQATLAGAAPGPTGTMTVVLIGYMEEPA